MQDSVPSTIAQVLFEAGSTLNFAQIVAEMEQVLHRLKPAQLEVSWDCDDLVFFDMDETRIAFGFVEFPDSPLASCLTVSAGPRWDAMPLVEDPGFDLLCSRIIERLQSHFQPLAVLWNQTFDEVDAELIDAMTDALPAPDSILPPVEDLVGSLWQTAEAAEAARAPLRLLAMPIRPEEPGMPAGTPSDRETLSRMAAARPMPRAFRRAANDVPASAPPYAPDLERLRAALYQDEAEADGGQMSTQMRLAVHAMNATLIAVWMPLGAAVMTYSLLKGENMRVSGRIMALTGTFMAVMHSPFGQSVATAVAGTLS